VGAQSVTYQPIRPYGATSIGALGIAGQFFTMNGQPWTSIQTSELSLPKRYLAGEDVRLVLAERAALGFNDTRQWLLNQSVVAGAGYPEGIHPNQYPDFYERLRDLWELCGSYGLAVEATAFTSCLPLMPNRNDQQRHWDRTQEAARGLGYVRLELVNEYDWGHGENAPDRSLWSMRPSGILASSGSSTADAPPPTPVWDYVLYHSNSLNEWQRKVGHNAMEWGDVYHCPGHSNENTRYPDNDSSETHAYDAAMGSALLCAGSCFHSQGGKFSRPFDATERRCAAAWVAGAKSVPLEFQRGRYIHRTDLEGPHCIRAYERRLPDGRGHAISIRP
jgi:hypothetical protein